MWYSNSSLIFSSLLFLWATSVVGQGQIVLDSTHNATALGGTWSTGSGAVITGSPYVDPISMRVLYPNTTGRGISFVDTPNGSFFEQFDYRITSNASNPNCITAVITWQHGDMEYLPNGSLLLKPFGADGFQQVENPCSAFSNQVTRYNQSILFSMWRVFPLPGGTGVHLNLYEFDGTPVAPMNLIANPPNMLPTHPIITPIATASGNIRRDLVARNSASSSRLVYMTGSIGLMILLGAITVLL